MTQRDFVLQYAGLPDYHLLQYLNLKLGTGSIEREGFLEGQLEGATRTDHGASCRSCGTSMSRPQKSPDYVEPLLTALRKLELRLSLDVVSHLSDEPLQTT